MPLTASPECLEKGDRDPPTIIASIKFHNKIVSYSVTVFVIPNDLAIAAGSLSLAVIEIEPESVCHFLEERQRYELLHPVTDKLAELMPSRRSLFCHLSNPSLPPKDDPRKAGRGAFDSSTLYSDRVSCLLYTSDAADD